MNALVIPPLTAGQLPALPAADIDRAASYARQDKAPATRAAYRSDFGAFKAWCLARSVSTLPASPETVAAYLASEAEAGRKPSTIGRRCAAIRYAHKLAGHEPPTNSEAVKATLRGIRHSIGTAPNRKAPVLAETARAMAFAAPDGLKGLGRDGVRHGNGQACDGVMACQPMARHSMGVAGHPYGGSWPGSPLSMGLGFSASSLPLMSASAAPQRRHSRRRTRPLPRASTPRVTP
jgi:hypothetical protein